MLNRSVELAEKLSPKLYFTLQDLANILKLKPESTRVLLSRYTKKGIFIRMKKDFYVLRESFKKFTAEDFFQIANLLQVPSYISFLTALNFYEVTTQVQRDFFESAALKRSKKFEIKGIVFAYYKIKKCYYFDFIRLGNFFIASKEKAFVDSVYLYSFGKYKIDFSALDLTKLDKSKINKIIKVYPDKTKAIVKKIWRI
ncbi:MAG: hypothetical protein ABIK93_05265 [candidate division WOR-3 bacterium]